MTNQQTLIARWAGISIFWSVVSFLVLVISLFMRQGLSTPYLLTISIFAAALTIFNAPFILPRRFSFREQQSVWKPSLLCALSLLLPLFALIVGSFFILVLIPTGLFGFWNATKALNWNAARKKSLLAASVGLLLALLLATYIVDCGNWLYTPEIAQAGLLLPDLYYHFSLTEMLRTYSSVSLGVHGLLPLTYHFGSHLWFAAFSTLVDHGIEYAYSFGMTIVLIPALFFSLCVATATLASKPLLSKMKFVCLMGFVVGATILLDKIGWHSYYISPSYTIGLALFMLALPLLHSEKKNFNPSYFFLLMAIIVPLSMMKVSTGMLWGGACCYFFLTAELKLRHRVILIVTTVIVTALCVKLLISPAQQTVERSISFAFFHFYLSYGSIYSLSGLIPPAVLFLITAWCLYRRGKGALPPAVQAILPMAKIMLFVSALSLIPGGLIPIAGGSAWYFINVAQWVCLPVVAYYLIVTYERDTQLWRLKRVIALFSAVIVTALLIMAVRPSSIEPLRQLSLNSKDNRTASLTKFTVDNLRDHGTLLPTDVKETIATLPVNKLIARLRAEKAADFLVYIPPAANWFWRDAGDCMSKTFLIPGITGHPLLYGLPPDIACVTDYYDQSVLNMRSRPLDETSMCSEAARLGFGRIAVVAEDGADKDLMMVSCAR